MSDYTQDPARARDQFQAPGRLYKPSKFEHQTLTEANFTPCIASDPKCGYVRRMTPIELPAVRMTLEVRMEKHAPDRWRAALFILSVATAREPGRLLPGETLATRRPLLSLEDASRGFPRPIAGKFGHVLWKCSAKAQRHELR